MEHGMGGMDDDLGKWSFFQQLFPIASAAWHV
jgi:hypothetical protein